MAEGPGIADGAYASEQKTIEVRHNPGYNVKKEKLQTEVLFSDVGGTLKVTKSEIPGILQGDCIFSVNGLSSPNPVEMRTLLMSEQQPFFVTVTRKLTFQINQPAKTSEEKGELSPEAGVEEEIMEVSKENSVADEKMEDGEEKKGELAPEGVEEEEILEVSKENFVADEKIEDGEGFSDAMMLEEPVDSIVFSPGEINSQDDWDANDVDDCEWPEDVEMPDMPEAPSASNEPGQGKSEMETELEEILKMKNFKTNTDVTGDWCFFVSIVILRFPHTSIETLLTRGLVIKFREEACDLCREASMPEHEIESIGNPNMWSSEMQLSRLAQIIKIQVRLWKIAEGVLLDMFTTPPVEVPEGNFDDQRILDLLWCNNANPLSSENRNAFLPLLSSDFYTPGLDRIQWPQEGGELSNWENSTMSVVSEGLPHDIEEQLEKMQNINEGRNVTIGVLMYTKNGSEIGLIRSKEDNVHNIPHGEFLQTDPLESLHSMLDDHLYIYDPKCFGVLPRILNVTQDGNLIIIFPSICNCEIRLMNDQDYEWVWLKTDLIEREQLTNIVPGSMRRIILAGLNLLQRFASELPPVESRDVREEAAVATHRMADLAAQQKKHITSEEFFEYFLRNEKQRSFVLSNYSDEDKLAGLFDEIVKYLENCMHIKADLNDEPQEVWLEDVNIQAKPQPQKRVKSDAEIAMELYEQELMKQFYAEERQNNRANNYSRNNPPKVNFSPPLRVEPRRERNPPVSSAIQNENAKRRLESNNQKVLVLQTFQTKGHPVETMQKDWVLHVKKRESNMILVDHPNLQYLQWIGKSDWHLIKDIVKTPPPENKIEKVEVQDTVPKSSLIEPSAPVQPQKEAPKDDEDDLEDKQV